MSNDISICFYHNINVKEFFFPSERELKKALRDTLTRAAWYRLIDNGNLANQIARLAAIVVKKHFDHCDDAYCCR